jgi:hypothetical protein
MGAAKPGDSKIVRVVLENKKAMAKLQNCQFGVFCLLFYTMLDAKKEDKRVYFNNL